MHHLVTGAASGIGQQLALRLLADGERVCATDISFKGLQVLEAEAKPGQLLCASLDVRQPNQWREVFSQAVQAWGSIDALFNVAGVLRAASIENTSDDDVDFMIDVNLKGVIHGTRVALEFMAGQGKGGGIHGRIINVASLAGVAPIAGLTLYSTSKFGVRGFSLAAAEDVAEQGIKITVVCPDAVQTPMLDQQVDEPSAALTFSGNKILSTDDVVDTLINQALRKSPLEILLPSGRGSLAKFANAVPGADKLFRNALIRKGEKKQAKMKQENAE